jgi:formylglycine-generating enzyme required for sulfatase activity
MAPRLPRSARLRRALFSQQGVKQPASRAARSLRRRRRGNFFAFLAAQVLIAVVAFVVVTDYITDGPLKNAASNILTQVASKGRDTKSDQDALVAVKPSTVLDKAAGQETAAVQKLPPAIEPPESLPAKIQEPIAAVEPAPKAPEPPAVEPALQTAQPPAIVSAPPADELATASIMQPKTAEKVGEDVVALVPIPDLTPRESAPTAAPPSKAIKPKQADGLTIRDCATCPELVLINSGRFAMGAGSEGLEQQVSLTTTHEVQIAEPFAIGRYEITFDEWSQCVADGGCTSQPADENWGRGRRPVINVSFNDITQQYLPWLSRKTGFTYRLPTEAEWEFAARGGGAAPAGQAYSFGDDESLLCQHGNSTDLAGTGGSCSDGFANTAPAGSLKPNALGLFDMHGNVWEWMADCWQPQYSAKAAKPAEACNTRVLRGGSWASNAVALRSAARGWESQDKGKNSIGFRVVKVQP